ncbi:MAG: sel1 repeat family protein, partial [Proteobacteria bacterium]|nr:sel1 repeat family protein [Pseudomonadota bacterium]
GQCNLSKLYASGVGVQKDDKKAFYWAKKSAEANDSESQYLLGEAFLVGRGTEKNVEQALYWFRKSANQGYSDAFDGIKRAEKSSDSGKESSK